MKLLQALIFTFIFSAVAFAQATGSLRGQVVDQNGAVVPNATVVATNGNGIEKTVVSNAKGEYTVTGLPAGTYTVRANAETFADYENTEVTVTAGQREELVITLTVAIAAETVTVGGEQVNAEPENNASATVLKGEDLEALPEDPDELAAALQALAGSSAGPNGGQLYIDGFTGGRLPPREAIREIRINQNPFSSEFERPGFGRIEILTKPGADRLRGQAFFNFNDESLNSRNPFAFNRAPSQTRFYGGNISGPIIKNKASFFIDVDNRQIDDNAVINATILDSNLNPTLFAQSLIVPTRRFSISPRFDYAINDRNTLVARYSFQRNTADNRGIGEFSLPSLAYNTENTEHNIQLTETAILAPNIVNETRFQYNRQRNQQDGDNSIPTITVSGSFTGGGSSIGLNYTNEDRYELQNYTTWTLGKHNLRFGARLRGINLENRSESNFAGTFTFTGRPAVVNAQGVVEQPALSSIDQYRQELLGGINVRSNPNQFTITAGDPLASISQTDFGVFINDDWRVNPGLTLSFGLRYEAQTNVKNNLNIAPRFGFAYSPGAGGARPPKTVFRGGFGLFYDRIGENLSLNEVRFDGQRQLSYTVNDPLLLAQPIFTSNGVTNVPTIEQIAAVAPGSSTIRRLSGDIRSPLTMNGAFSVERQLPFRTTLSATYLMTRSYNLLRQRNVNAPVCPPGFACPVNDRTLLNALRPDPTQGNIYEYESTGEFNQNQLIINFNTRLNPKFSLFGNYRLNRAKSDVDGGGGFGFGFGGAGLGGFPFYSYDLSDEYGNSTQDVRHFGFIGGSVEVPFGIRFNPFITIRSGSPFNIVTGFDRNGDGQFTERPTFRELGARCQTLGLTSSFCDVSDVSNLDEIIPRNYGRGPGSFNVNMNITKTFGFGGSRRSTAAAGGGQAEQGGSNAGIPGVGGGGRRGGGGGGGRGGQGGGGGRGGFGGGETPSPYNLTLGLQVSNLFNNVNTGNPINNLSSDRFGQFNSLGGFGGFGGGGGSNAGNRRVTLQLRFSF